MSESKITATGLCVEQVRRLDHDRYLIAMAALTRHRAALMSLYAFNTEIAGIQASVSETMLGEIKLQWWRDQVHAACNDGPRPNGIAGALYDTIREHQYTPALFDTLLSARIQDLDEGPPRTLEDLKSYCAGTSSTLIQLSLQATGHDKAEDTITDVSRDAGIAWAMVGLVRALPYQIAHGRCSIPQDMLEKSSLDWRHMHRADLDTILKPLVAVLCGIAGEHLQSARKLSESIPSPSRAPLLVLPLARYYLARLRRANFNVFDPGVQHPGGAGKILRLIWAAWSKRL